MGFFHVSGSEEKGAIELGRRSRESREPRKRSMNQELSFSTPLSRAVVRTEPGAKEVDAEGPARSSMYLPASDSNTDQKSMAGIDIDASSSTMVSLKAVMDERRKARWIDYSKVDYDRKFELRWVLITTRFASMI